MTIQMITGKPGDGMKFPYHIGCYVVVGATGLSHATQAIYQAERKGKHSGQPFQCMRSKVFVWLRGHYHTQVFLPSQPGQSAHHPRGN